MMGRWAPPTQECITQKLVYVLLRRNTASIIKDLIDSISKFISIVSSVTKKANCMNYVNCFLGRFSKTKTTLIQI